MVVIIGSCDACAHYIGVLNGKLVCEAFPDGIPDDILEGFDHTQPHDGDHGIRYEPVKP